jgi:hypothetical protein
MKRLHPWWSVAALAIAALTPGGFVRVASAATPADAAISDATTRPAEFMRFVDDGHSGGSLQTADVTFKNAAGAEVHLIGAIHIGEDAYYKSLVKDFQSYDAVLYELVMPRDAAPPAPGDPPSDSSVSQIQRMMTSLLDLKFQLDGIDYTAPNFVHADLDRETFDQMQADRGESFESIILRQVFNQMAKPTAASQADTGDQLRQTIAIFMRPDGRRQLKVALAQELSSPEADIQSLLGPGPTVLVTERNKAAMKVLQQQLSSGKKKLAIFYGAAHMPDMSDRLVAMGFSPVKTEWRVAWDLTIRADEPSLAESLLDQATSMLFGPPKDKPQPTPPSGAAPATPNSGPNP